MVRTHRAILFGEHELRFIDMARDAANRYKIRPELFFGLISQESGWKKYALSHSGAIGLTQLMPATAFQVCPDSFSRANPWRIYEEYLNLDCGARYLARQLKDFKGCETCALSAYNAGPAATADAGGFPPNDQARDYVPRVQFYSLVYSFLSMR